MFPQGHKVTSIRTHTSFKQPFDAVRIPLTNPDDELKRNEMFTQESQKLRANSNRMTALLVYSLYTRRRQTVTQHTFFFGVRGEEGVCGLAGCWTARGVGGLGLTGLLLVRLEGREITGGSATGNRKLDEESCA